MNWNRWACDLPAQPPKGQFESFSHSETVLQLSTVVTDLLFTWSLIHFLLVLLMLTRFTFHTKPAPRTSFQARVQNESGTKVSKLEVSKVIRERELRFCFVFRPVSFCSSGWSPYVVTRLAQNSQRSACHSLQTVKIKCQPELSFVSESLGLVVSRIWLLCLRCKGSSAICWSLG